MQLCSSLPNSLLFHRVTFIFSLKRFASQSIVNMKCISRISEFTRLLVACFFEELAIFMPAFQMTILELHITLFPWIKAL